MTLQETFDWLTARGIEYTLSDNYITSISPHWSSDIWVNACMSSGDYYIGGCCANSSRSQDILCAAFRDGGEFRSDALHDLAALGLTHDGEASYWGNAPISDKLPEDPWDYLAYVYRRIRPHLAHARFPGPVFPSRYPLENEILTLGELVFRYRWHKLIQNGKEADAGTDAENTLFVHRLWGVIKPLHDHMRESMCVKTVEAFAVCLDNEVIGEFRAEARLAKAEIEASKDHTHADKLYVGLVRVTAEKGYEILSRVEHIVE